MIGYRVERRCEGVSVWRREEVMETRNRRRTRGRRWRRSRWRQEEDDRRRRRVESIWGSTRNPGQSTPMNPSSSRKSPLNHHNVSCCYGDRTRGPKRLTGRQRGGGKEMGFIGTRGNTTSRG